MILDWYVNKKGVIETSHVALPASVTIENGMIELPRYNPKLVNSDNEPRYEIVDQTIFISNSESKVYDGADIRFDEKTRKIDDFGYVTYSNAKFVLSSISGDDVWVYRAVYKNSKPASNEIGISNIEWTDRRLDRWSSNNNYPKGWSGYERSLYYDAKPNDLNWSLYNTVKNAWADSELTEVLGGENVVYRALNTAVNFRFDEGINKYFLELPPWVEGVAGPGIGQTLHLEYWQPFANIIILDGYVDLLNPRYYKENNRVKDLLITGKDDQGKTVFTKTVTLVDIPEFQKFQFPSKVKFVDLTIESVYKGTKYDDTCIRSAFAWPIEN